MPKFKAVCSGGGTRGAVFCGAFAFFEEKGWEVEEAVGVSAGSIFLGALSSGRSAREVLEMQKDFLPSKVLDPRILSFWPFVDGTKGFFKGDKILKAMRAQYPKDYNHTTFPLHIATHNWTTRHQVTHTEGDLPLHVRASMSLPIFDMVEIDGDLHEDGGVSGNFKLDYDGWKIQSDSPVVGFAFRSGTKPRKRPKNKIDRVSATINDLIRALDRENVDDGLKLGAHVVTLRTRHEGLDLDMTEEDADAMFAEGYESARRWWEDNGL